MNPQPQGGSATECEGVSFLFYYYFNFFREVKGRIYITTQSVQQSLIKNKNVK